MNQMIQDIEDLLPDNERPYRNKKFVKKHFHKKPAPNTESFLPCSFKIYIKTWGCSHNNSDGEYMAGLLAEYGFLLTDNPESSDLWLLNSCTVKNPSEDSLRHFILKARERGIPVVVAGCVPQGTPDANFMLGVSQLGVNQIDRIVEVTEETLKGNTVKLLERTRKNGGKKSLNLPKVRRNQFVEIIAISSGCLNQCTYCKTKYARGHLGSYSVEEIVQRAVACFEEGVVEIWITSEDTGAYGKDIGSSLPELLWQLVAVTPEYAMIRVGMTNPPYIMEHMEVCF